MSVFKKVYKEIKKVNTVSFDIFDTLILRPYIKPTDLFVHMEKYFMADGFAKNRVSAEIEARQKANCPEVTLDDIYLFVADEYKPLKSKEIFFETQVLQPNNEIKKIYDYALSCGKQVIITSDMYLPKDVIENILKKTGYFGYKKLYLSSELKKTKSCGDLYEFIKQDLGTDNILHIGDNYDSDYVKAKEHGFIACHYEKPITKFIEKSNRISCFVNDHSGNLFASIIVGVLSINKQNSLDNNYWENIGFDYAGPSIYTYVEWLDEKFKLDNIDDALFVARDGYSIQKVYEIIKTSSATKTYYLYAPRILNLICNLDLDTQLSYGGLEASAAISTVVDYFKQEKCFDGLNIPDNSNVVKQIEFVRENLEEYKKLANQEKEKYVSYLESHGFKDNIAVVDTISGFLSSQKFLESIFNRKIKGYYWIVWASTDTTKHDVATLQDERDILFHEWNLMEFFMTAPTPPIQNVVCGKPQFKKVLPYEQVRIDTYPHVSQGCLEFAKTIKHIFADIKIYSDYLVLIDWVNSLVDMPTNEDKKHFVKIKHAYDANHTQFIPLCAKWYRKKYEKVKQYYLFRFIPVISKKKKYCSDTVNYQLFDLVSVWKKRHKGKYKKYYLFGFIPVFKVKL